MNEKPGHKKMFLCVDSATALSGFSERHFRRIIEKEKIRKVLIKGKIFILGSDFEKWQNGQRKKTAT